VLDSTLKVSLMSAVLNAAAETIIVTGLEADAIKAEAISALPNVEVIRLPLENGKIPLDLLIIQLANRNITSLLVEGGSEVHGAFKDAGLADRVYGFIAPKVVGGKNGFTPIGGVGSATIEEGWQLDEVEYKLLGQDLLITGKIKEA
jgi:diaminohydroxyphosphoribosylaminopyrimidine deaminase/5-amino-6-(5-phosphoribosylamino)uracil reductase